MYMSIYTVYVRYRHTHVYTVQCGASGIMIMAVPPPKRPRMDLEKQSQSQTLSKSVSECVLRRNKELLNNLNMDEVLNAMVNPDLTFLLPEETEKLQILEEHSQRSEKNIRIMLNFIKHRQEQEARDDACRKLVACIIQSKNHRGHEELNKIFHFKLPPEEWMHIQCLLSVVDDSPMPSPYRTPQPPKTPSLTSEIVHKLNPERPVAFIQLQGQLGERDGFETIERDLWHSFSIGDYCKLDDTVKGVQSDRTFKVEVDCQIVAKWFNSLIIMHRDGDYTMAIKELLDALVMCTKENCINVTILEGRIQQRIAQNYLMLGRKDEAMSHFALAKDRLQMVGRGYDKANMFCREAKIMSALEPEKRDEIEDTYDRALSVLEKDDAYFLASFPSITMSKAGFYLRVSFGSKASREESLPDVFPSDIAKAEQTLNTINEHEHIHLEMRQFEYNFLRAELCRLQGRMRESREMFTVLLDTPGSSKVSNILSLARQRLQKL